MSTFTRHIPGFVDIGDEPPPAVEFATTNDLLLLDVVQRYGEAKDFSHFAVSDSILMAVYTNSWFVVGYIENPGIIDLPIWHANQMTISA